MRWYLQVWKNYANFDGRARRKEYWMFYLFNIIFVTIAYVLALVAGLAAQSTELLMLFTIILGIYGLAILIPSIAVVVRRLHDQDKSGAWYFISFVPFIGGIWMLVLLCTEGTPGPNQYGEDPKAST